MKLDFLQNINEYEDHVVRLYDFDRQEAVKFKGIIETLLQDRKPVELSTIDFIEAVNCMLCLRLTEEDEGITTEDNIELYCDLSLDGYQEMLILIEPFCVKEKKAIQWLYELDNPIDFLFSAGKVPVVPDDEEIKGDE